MKTPLGFTLRRHLYGGPTADLPANNCFDGIDYPRFQPQKGDAKSARKMLDTCAVNVVFVCIAIRVLCVLICTILTNDEVFSCKVLQNWIFYEAQQIQKLEPKFCTLLSYFIFITSKGVSQPAMLPSGNKGCDVL